MTDQNSSTNDTPQYVIDKLQQFSEEAIQEEKNMLKMEIMNGVQVLTLLSGLESF